VGCRLPQDWDQGIMLPLSVCLGGHHQNHHPFAFTSSYRGVAIRLGRWGVCLVVPDALKDIVLRDHAVREEYCWTACLIPEEGLSYPRTTDHAL